MTEAPALNGANKHERDHRDPKRRAVAHHKPEREPQGGRLKFYKDGKFILELARARDAWVSVPRRTFWPRTRDPSERAPSLSVSDDGGSARSSPRRRDRRRKRPDPRRGLSGELAGAYVRPSELPAALLSTGAARRKRRRPFDRTPVAPPNGISARPPNGTGDRSPDDGTNGPASDERRVGKFKFFRRSSERVSVRVYKKRGTAKRREGLSKIVEALAARGPTVRSAPVSIPDPTAVPAAAANRKREHVSPRKRILRELERVSLEDKANKRPRSRATVAVVAKPGPSRPSAEPAKREPPAPKPGGSYSINSILSMPEESSPRRSPPDAGVSRSSPRVLGALSPVGSPSPRAPPDRLAFPASPPRPIDKYYHEAYPSVEDPSQTPYSFFPSQYFPPAAYIGTAYPPYGPRAPASLSYSWSPYPMMPPGIWAPLPRPLLTDRFTREDATSDVPLNLSKH